LTNRHSSTEFKKTRLKVNPRPRVGCLKIRLRPCQDHDKPCQDHV
jgi:hypothetical protein